MFHGAYSIVDYWPDGRALVERNFPGSTEYAGYAMAATSFFALAYTLTQGAHIRVSILLNLNNLAAVIAIPDLLTPGTKDKICINPIKRTDL